MIKEIRKSVFVLLLGVSSLLLSSVASAQDWPLVGGDYWEVTSIKLEDGGSLKYANWLASEWRENLEFTKKKGWIKDYMILANVHARADEPDLYLIRVMESVVSGPEGRKRGEEFREWKKKSIAKMQEESGNRAKYREVRSSSLLQLLSFRD